MDSFLGIKWYDGVMILCTDGDDDLLTEIWLMKQNNGSDELNGDKEFSRIHWTISCKLLCSIEGRIDIGIPYGIQTNINWLIDIYLFKWIR